MQQGFRPGRSPCLRVALALIALAGIGAGVAFAEPRLLEERSSTYNNIYVYKDGSNVLMTFGHNRRFYTESIYDSTDELALPVTYTRFMTVGLAYANAADNLLEIGFGGGRTAWYLHKHVPKLDITCVELDPAVVELAQKHFGGWQGERSAPVELAAPTVGARRFVIVDRGPSPQTALRIGTVGVPRSTPDYVPLEVMNGILGGLFSNRINMNLRERNGYTYGARSGFGYRRGAGPFVIQTSVRADVSAPAVQEIFKEIDGLRERPVDAAELTLSKDSFSRSLPGLFETTADAAASAGQLFVYGLPLDYYNGLPAQVEAVRAEDVQRVMRERVDPDHLVVVAVGDKATLEPELRKLSMGTVESRVAE